MNNDILFSNPHHVTKLSIILGMCLIAAFVGFFATTELLRTVAIIPAILYFICLVKKPLWAYFLFLLITFDLFGLITEHFLQLPGAFKLRDVLNFSLLAYVFISIATNRKTSVFVRSALNPFIMLFMCFILFVVLYTAFEFDVSIISCLRIPRKYLLYLSFFVVLYLVRNEKDFKKFFIILSVIGVVSCIIMIAQFLLASKIIFIPHAQIKYQQLGGFYLPRVYLPSIDMSFLFSIYFWLYISNNKKKYLMLAILFGISGFLCFSRAYWFKMFIGATIPFFFTYSYEKNRFFKKVMEFISILFILAICSQLLGLDIMSFFVKLFERIQSAYLDLINRSGTFGYRLEASADRLKYFLDSPLFGVGFLHYSSATESLKAAFMRGYYVETVDSGLLSLLTTMGLSGVVVILILSVAFFIRNKKAIKTTNTMFYRGISLGCIGYFVGGTLSFLTLPFFISTQEIPVIAIAFAFIEKILQLNNYQDETSSGNLELSEKI